MTRFAVLYRPAGSDAAPIRWDCMAASGDAARAQCEAAFPGCAVVVVRPA